ncbi:hypothetical protein WN51_14312 [Melipona quadrifasciata]|uniref:Uncharacterized protein n=1 Tax=Melipona quadrifasciata TaxID=166423 RepID=A0A0M9A114_9HYME|nr:hypothetical protein WN51_14312 [Melipona quadrifasciata]
MGIESNKTDLPSADKYFLQVVFPKETCEEYTLFEANERNCKNKIESEESSEEVVSFTRRVINRISSNSDDSDDEESYASEDFEEMLKEFAIAEEEELNNDCDSLDNIQWNEVRLISTKYGGRVDKRGKAAKIDFVSEILTLFERSINLVSSAYNARDSSLNESYLPIHVQSACIKDEFNGAKINHHFVFGLRNACFSRTHRLPLASRVL